jgi:hypothetical protein
MCYKKFIINGQWRKKPGLRSPEQAIPELEISWVSEERKELEEEEYGTKLEMEPEHPLSETPWNRWKKDYLNRFVI